MRSRAAASILRENGFGKTFSMAGGMSAWEGLVAEGPPESGIAYFPPESAPEELIGLAWMLEDGSGRFYASVPDVISDEDVQNLFRELVVAEAHHKTALVGVYREISGREPGPDFPLAIIGADADRDVMEGGMRLSEALAWIRGKSAESVLDLAISLEANSYDLYLKMVRHLQDNRAKGVFEKLSAEEKTHIKRLAAVLDRKA